MDFRIADTFTDSLTKLTAKEQKAVKTTAFDLQLNPAKPSMQFHRIDRSRDQNFWSITVTMDLRIIVHKTSKSLLLCYVDHHDAAYRWAINRKIERHPKTGAAQLVELHERIEEIGAYGGNYVPDQISAQARNLFADTPADDLLRYGVPESWIDAVRKATEDTLFDLVVHLPQEAAEALLELATGGTPQVPLQAGVDADPFEHADAQRRFNTLADAKALERAMDFPWERWAIFLHPSQRQFVESRYSGPVRISGSAGTGKTVVALHRAVYQARTNPDARILLTTFWRTLAEASATKLDRLVGNEPEIRSRIVARSLRDICNELYAHHFGKPNVIPGANLRALLEHNAAAVCSNTLGLATFMDEWEGVIDAFQIQSWAEYRESPRHGRRIPLDSGQRETLWAAFARVRHALAANGQVTVGQMFGRLASLYGTEAPPPFDFVIVDEAQDLGVAELRFLAALGRSRPDSLFFTGDLGQRIFRQPFPWQILGIDIRGRTHTLPINYRTSHQIRANADRLLPDRLVDADGIEELREGTVSLFNGPVPVIAMHGNTEAEAEAVAAWLRHLAAEVPLREIGIFVRSPGLLQRARRALDLAGLKTSELSDIAHPQADTVSLGPMHLAKGLEFRAVAVMACDAGALPLRSRIEVVGEAADLEDVYTTERHLLYVACSRAREHLLITGVEPGSRFLDALRS